VADDFVTVTATITRAARESLRLEAKDRGWLLSDLYRAILELAADSGYDLGPSPRRHADEGRAALPGEENDRG
jgi:hypothetical protein